MYSGRGARRWTTLLWWSPAVLVPSIFLLLFFAWPAATLVARGFTNEAGALDLSAFHEVFARPRTWRIIGLTLGMAAVATVLSVVLGVPGAHILYRCRFPGRGIVRGIVAVPFVLPTVVVGVAFRSLLARHGWLGFLEWDGTVTAVIAAMVFFNYSLVVRSVGTVWSRLDPRMAEAAQALGATPLRAFLTVTVPAITPAIASVASVVFLFCATAFGIVLILGGVELATIESEIYLLTTAFLDLRSAAVLSIVQLLVITGALWVAGMARRRGERALKLRSDAVEHPLGRADLPALAVTVAVVCGVILLPLVALLVRSFQRKGQFTVDNWLDLANANLSRAVRVSAFEAAWNSLVIAAQAAAIALVLGVLVALVVTRTPRSVGAQRALALLDGAFMLPLGVSAVTVGFGFLITLNQPPLDLRSSPLLIPIAQAVVAIPLVVRLVAPVLRAIDPRQREAASALGAHPLRVLLTVDGAHLVRAGAVAVGFAFATSLGEFGATSFLARPEAPTLPVMIYRLISRPGAPEQGVAVAASVLLAVIAATVMVLVERGRPSTAGEFS
ncbi:ABC transporter permease [Schaalia canis]|uniref:Iron ABC transporter permease n=1 Tax=Schaalia canis TaxID=100469 RepID=A0A3P1SEK4_9ACTO|nr:iron ABC transporter permease [Schaalia canis]RRC94742.1 iron ABC transporter permease [Schaalia canis]